MLMFMPTTADAPASTLPTTHTDSLPNSILPVPREQVRHMLFGSPAAVQSSIRRLHQLGYAEVHDWSRLISTGRPGEVMAILTKRLEGN